jgi:hypothetical protein
MSSKISEIKTVFRGLQTLYETYLPKADPILVHDLLLREQENPKVAPVYMVEIFTELGIKSYRLDQSYCLSNANERSEKPRLLDNMRYYLQ